MLTTLHEPEAESLSEPTRSGRSESAGFLSRPHVQARYGISAVTLWRWERDPRLAFPAAVLVHRRWFYRVADLERWERARVRSRLQEVVA